MRGLPVGGPASGGALTGAVARRYGRPISAPVDTTVAPLPACEQLRRYVVVMTVVGLIIFVGALALPVAFGLAVPALIGAGIVTVLLGRSVGWVALAAPLVPCLIWGVAFAVLIAVGTDSGSDERGLASVFAFLAIAFVAVGGVLCAFAGCLWGAAMAQRSPRAPG